MDFIGAHHVDQQITNYDSYDHHHQPSRDLVPLISWFLQIFWSGYWMIGLSRLTNDNYFVLSCDTHVTYSDNFLTLTIYIYVSSFYYSLVLHIYVMILMTIFIPSGLFYSFSFKCAPRCRKTMARGS